MNNLKLKVGVLVFIFSFCIFLPKLNAEQELLFPRPQQTISMDFQDARLKDILKIFSIQSGLNFIASEGVQDRTITLYLDKTPIKDAMDKLFKANNIYYELDKGSSIFIVKDWGKPQIETVTKVFYLKYATVSTSSLKEDMAQYITTSEEVSTSGSSSESTSGSSSGSTSAGTSTGEGGKWKKESDAGITAAVKKLLSEHGSVMEDFRTNSLIVTDIPSRMPVIEKTIAALDIAVPQVMLEVEMLDVSKNVVDKIGLDWSQISGTKLVVTGATLGTKFPFEGLWPKNWGLQAANEAAYKSAAGTMNLNAINLVLNFLKTQTDTKYLARPRLRTLNNETAEIRISTSESVGITTTTASTGGSSGSTTQEAERAQTGVILRVTPQINTDTGEVTMFVYPKVSEAITGNTLTAGTAGSFVYRDPEERSTKTVVRVKDGETVVVGGLIRNEYSLVTYKLPILGDLPLIGFLFRHKGATASGDKNKQRELLVFITPHILKETNTELAQAKKVSVPEREQGATSGSDRQAAINASLNTFEKKKK